MIKTKKFPQPVQNLEENVKLIKFSHSRPPEPNRIGLEEEKEIEDYSGGELESPNEVFIPDNGTERFSSSEEDNDFKTESESKLSKTSESLEEESEEEENDDWNEPPPVHIVGFNQSHSNDEDSESEDDDELFNPGSEVVIGSAFEGKKEVEKDAPPITLEDPEMPEILSTCRN